MSPGFIRQLPDVALVTDGFTSIGDINGDGQLDVVVVKDKTSLGGGGIWVWDPRTRATIASAPAGLTGGVAFVGNVQGDCKPEIGMTFERELRMYQYDGSPQLKLLYNLPPPITPGSRVSRCLISTRMVSKNWSIGIRPTCASWKALQEKRWLLTRSRVLPGWNIL